MTKEELKKRYSTSDGLDLYKDWIKHPVTVDMMKAIWRASRPKEKDDISVEFGRCLGMDEALHIMELDIGMTIPKEVSRLMPNYGLKKGDK